MIQNLNIQFIVKLQNNVRLILQEKNIKDEEKKNYFIKMSNKNFNYFINNVDLKLKKNVDKYRRLGKKDILKVKFFIIFLINQQVQLQIVKHHMILQYLLHLAK